MKPDYIHVNGVTIGKIEQRAEEFVFTLRNGIEFLTAEEINAINKRLEQITVKKAVK